MPFTRERLEFTESGGPPPRIGRSRLIESAEASIAGTVAPGLEMVAPGRIGAVTPGMTSSGRRWLDGRRRPTACAGADGVATADLPSMAGAGASSDGGSSGGGILRTRQAGAAQNDP